MAFYFGWMNFYSTFILIPAAVGVIMYFIRGVDITVDTDAYLPFYSIFMVIWAVLFLVVCFNYLHLYGYLGSSLSSGMF